MLRCGNLNILRSIIQISQKCSRETGSKLQYHQVCCKEYSPKKIIRSKISCQLLFPKRTLIDKVFKRPTLNAYKIQDNVPAGYNLIYKNTMDRYLFALQIISYAMGAIVCLILILKEDVAHSKMDFSDFRFKTGSTDNEALIYMSCLLMLIVVINLFIRKMPLRIYKSSSKTEYMVVINYGSPFQNKMLPCKVGEVHQLPPRGILPWRDNKFVVKTPYNEYTVILLDTFFQCPADLNIMLGYQIDPDLDN